jgi:hypothetical protein
LLNSRYPLFFTTNSSFSPEVTKIICRVPLVLFFFSPKLTQPANLC